MKKVGGMFWTLCSLSEHLESADLRSNLAFKENAPQEKSVRSFSCEPCSTLQMVYHETSFEPQRVFPQNGNN